MFRKLLHFKVPFTKLTDHSSNVSKTIRRNYVYYCRNPDGALVPACYTSTLENGVTVISEQICSPLAAVCMFVDTGPQHEMPCTNGITYFIERLAFQGFKSTEFKKKDIEEKIACIGARLDCKTTREYQMFTASCPPIYVADMLEIFSKILYDLDFSDIDRVKEEIYQDLNDTENDPKKLCFDQLHQCAFHGTPLGLPVIGPLENYLNFDEEYTANYIKEMYTPQRITIACSAALTHVQIVCATQRVFSYFKEPESPLLPGPARFTGSQIMYRRDDMPFSYNAIAVEAPGFHSGIETYLQMRLLTEVMGAWDMSQGNGYRIWPETALHAAMGNMCVSYEAFYIPYTKVGLFGVYFVAANGTELDDMVFNIQTHWMKMCTSMNSRDISRAAHRLKLKLAREALGAQNSCTEMALHMTHYSKMMDLCTLWSTVESLNLSQIKTLADKCFYDRCIACSSVGPTEALPDYLRIRSGMYWLRC